ncbi:unnamed protein product, partial [Ascophyllum nodosum]
WGPPAKPPQQRRPPPTSQFFGSTWPRRQILRRVRLHTPRTAAVSSRRVTCLLLPIAGGLLRQNRGKIGLLIQAVRKAIFAPARFWDRGARYFVVRLYVLEQLGDELQRFLEEI